MKFLQRVILLVSFLLLTACSQQIDTEQAPAIAYGEDVCENCSMIISDERFAAAYWTADGVARRFDDIGGMVEYHQDRGEDVATFWVHDYPTGEWVRAESATFVLNKEMQTPMGFGIAACANEEQAKALAYGEEGAVVLSWAGLLGEEDAGISAHEHNDHN
jgi:copper chaperone NosL